MGGREDVQGAVRPEGVCSCVSHSIGEGVEVALLELTWWTPRHFTCTPAWLRCYSRDSHLRLMASYYYPYHHMHILLLSWPQPSWHPTTISVSQYLCILHMVSTPVVLTADVPSLLFPGLLPEAGPDLGHQDRDAARTLHQQPVTVCGADWSCMVGVAACTLAHVHTRRHGSGG